MKCPKCKNKKEMRATDFTLSDKGKYRKHTLWVCMGCGYDIVTEETMTDIEREIVRLALDILKEAISGSLILSRKHRDAITELRLKLGPDELPSAALDIDGIIAKLEGE